jgi:hypothetical protein
VYKAGTRCGKRVEDSTRASPLASRLGSRFTPTGQGGRAERHQGGAPSLAVPGLHGVAGHWRRNTHGHDQDLTSP